MLVRPLVPGWSGADRSPGRQSRQSVLCLRCPIAGRFGWWIGQCLWSGRSYRWCPLVGRSVDPVAPARIPTRRHYALRGWPQVGSSAELAGPSGWGVWGEGGRSAGGTNLGTQGRHRWYTPGDGLGSRWAGAGQWVAATCRHRGDTPWKHPPDRLGTGWPPGHHLLATELSSSLGRPRPPACGVGGGGGAPPARAGRTTRRPPTRGKEEAGRDSTRRDRGGGRGGRCHPPMHRKQPGHGAKPMHRQQATAGGDARPVKPASDGRWTDSEAGHRGRRRRDAAPRTSPNSRSQRAEGGHGANRSRRTDDSGVIDNRIANADTPAPGAGRTGLTRPGEGTGWGNLSQP